MSNCMAKENENFPRRDDRVAYGGARIKGDGKNKKTNGGRKQTTPRRKGGKFLRNRNTLIGGVAVVLIAILYFAFFFPNGTEVFVDEQSVGILEGRATTAEQVIETVETQLAGTVGSAVELNEKITIKGVHISGSREKDVCTMEYLIPKIRSMITYKVDAAIIMVDGGKTVVLATEEQAQAVLDSIQEPYLPDEGVEAEVSWLEKVETIKDFVDSDEIMSKEGAAAFLQTTTTVTSTYTVQSGDAPFSVASKNDTTLEEILALNPGMTVQTLIHPGDVLNIPVEKPMVSVKTVEVQVLTTVEPKTYEYQYDSTKPSSYQKVVQQGRAGQKKSTIQITRINGFVEEEKEVSKEILVEAVPEIISRGTQ